MSDHERLVHFVDKIWSDIFIDFIQNIAFFLDIISQYILPSSSTCQEPSGEVTRDGLEEIWKTSKSAGTRDTSGFSSLQKFPWVSETGIRTILDVRHNIN